MISVVKKGYAAGSRDEGMLRDDVLKAYKAEYSYLDWLGPDSWLRSICQALQSGKLK
jgi:hypothetical protein